MGRRKMPIDKTPKYCVVCGDIAKGSALLFDFVLICQNSLCFYK